VEEAIYQHLKELLASLDDEIHKKINILMSDNHELQRQKEEIEYAEQFLSNHIDKLTPIKFIKLWISHKTLKQQLLRKTISITEINVLHFPLF
jgi:hypothetical protein